MISTAKTDYAITKRISLAEEVAQLIKRLIFEQFFSSGERLIVDSLSKKLQVSVTPIREGLKFLVAQGLVVYDDKSYSVFNPSSEEVQELFAIRQYLERLAVKQAADNMDDSEIDSLFKEYKAFAESDGIYNSFDQTAMDKIFHDSILKGSKNKRLMILLKPIQEQCWLMRSWGFSNVYTREIAETAVRHHLKIINSIKQRNSEAAEANMKHHMEIGERGTLETYKIKTQ